MFYVSGILFKPPRRDYLKLHAALAHMGVLSWLLAVTIVPLLGNLVVLGASLYAVVVEVVIVETLGGVERGKAILIVLLPSLVCCGLGAIAAFFAGAALLGVIGLGAMAQ